MTSVARSVHRSVRQARVAIAMTAVGGWSAAAWANTAVTVVGSTVPSSSGTNPGNLRATQAYSNNAAPTSSTDVVIGSGTINPSGLILDSVSSSVTISVGSLDDTNTGVLSQIANNGSAGASTINLGGGSGTNTVGSTSDLIYVAAGSGTAFNITGGVTSGHTFSLTLAQSGNIDVGAGSTFYYNQGAAGSLGLGSNTLTTTGAGTITFVGTIAGAGGLTVAGSGTVTLAPQASAYVSTFTGPTSVQSGTLNLASTQILALGASSAVTVANHATLEINNHAGGTEQSYANAITLNGTTGNGGNGALYFLQSGGFSMSGPVTLATDSTVQFDPAAQGPSTSLVTFSNVITGPGSLTLYGNDTNGSGGPVTIGTPQVALTAANTYAGANTILTSANDGAATTFLVALSGGANRLPATTNLIFGGNPLGVTGTFNANVTLSVDNNSQTVASLSVASGATGAYSVVGSSASTGTLVVNNTVADTFSGTIGGSGTNNNNLALTKMNAGTLALSGPNTYAGGTTITSGTLQANNGTSSLGAGLATVSGGVLAGGMVAAPGATGGGGVSLVSGTITGGTGATTADRVGTLIVGTGVGTAAPVTLNATGGSTATYVAKVDPSLVAGSGTSETTANSPTTPVAVYTGASDELVVSNFAAGSSSVLTVAPMLTSNASGGTGSLLPGTSYHFVIANATGASQSNLSAFLSQFTLAPGSTPDAAGNTYSLDAAPDAANGGDDLLLDLTTAAAPEPSSLLLAAAAAIPLTLGRRRQSRATVRS